MIGFPHKKTNIGINLDLHGGIFITMPVGIPAPATKGLHVGVAPLAAPFWGLGSNKGNGSAILADGQPVVSRGHEVKYFVLPHLNVIPPPPVLNVLIPLLLLGSSSKCQCAASSVVCTDGPMAISMIMGYVGINSACADPCTMPTSIVPNWGTVNVGFTVGDIGAAVVLFALEAIKSKAEDVFFGKFAGAEIGRAAPKWLAGVVAAPLMKYIIKSWAEDVAKDIAKESVKAAAKLLYGESFGGKMGDYAADKLFSGMDKDKGAWTTDPAGTAMGKSADKVQDWLDKTADPVPAGGAE